MLALPFLASVYGPRLKTYDPDKPLPLYWSLKLDGYCLLIHKDEHGLVKCFTRAGECLTYSLRWHSCYALAVAHMPPEAIVAGELHTNATSSDVKTAIIAQDQALEFTAFGVPTSSTAASMLYAQLYCERIGYNFCAWGETSSKALPYPMTTGAALPKGIEGYVFRDGQYSNLQKWKPTRSIDLIVYAVFQGDGKYLGSTGALGVKTAEGLIIGKVSSGLSDLQRSDIWANPGSIIGRVVEVQYDSVWSNGGLRFPRLVRFRDDKPPELCSVIQDSDLVEKFNGRI